MIPATTPSPMRTHPTIHVRVLLLLATSSPRSDTDLTVSAPAYPFAYLAEEPARAR